MKQQPGIVEEVFRGRIIHGHIGWKDQRQPSVSVAVLHSDAETHTGEAAGVELVFNSPASLCGSLAGLIKQ